MSPASYKEHRFKEGIKDTFRIESRSRRLMDLDPRGLNAKGCHASWLTAAKHFEKKGVSPGTRLEKGVRTSRGADTLRRESRPRGQMKYKGASKAA